ncbi:MAG: hypothetical protein H6Q89_166 [Myxococcaceae bacterium]|nr:hypothetical protein [Myxococcaceae bacterium]
MAVARVAVRPPPPPPIRTAARAETPAGGYVVKSGDSLSAIAARNQLSLRELLEANPQIKNPNLIRVGQVIHLPGDSFTPAPPLAVVPPAAPPAPSTVSAASAAAIASVASRRELGQPVDNGGGTAVHDWDGLKVQDFAGGRDTEGRCMVVDGPAGAHLVRNDFYKHYLAGENHKALGAPIDDEHLENGVVVQHFERGAMSWSPTEGTKVTVNGAPAPAPAPGPAPAPAPAPSGPAPVDPTAPAGPAAAGSVYAPYQVAPGASVNGRLGVHWRSDQYDNDMGRAQRIIDQMKAMGAGYCTLLVDPTNPAANANLIRKLQENGITPVVRMYNSTPPDQWSDQDLQNMASCAKQLAGMGVKLVQVGNEPNLEGNLLARGVPRDEYLQRSAMRQAQALLVIRQAVGDSVKLGIPPMGCGSPDSDGTGTHAPQTYFPALLRAIHGIEQANGVKLCDWIPTHTYTMGQPGTDGPSQMGSTARGQLGWGPATGSWYEAQVKNILGYSAKSLSTEGGSEPNAFRNNPELVQAQMHEGMAQLQGNRNLTNCLWLLYDEKGLQSGEWGAWDKFALTDGEGAWGPGLAEYRQNYAQR